MLVLNILSIPLDLFMLNILVTLAAGISLLDCFSRRGEYLLAAGFGLAVLLFYLTENMPMRLLCVQIYLTILAFWKTPSRRGRCILRTCFLFSLLTLPVMAGDLLLTVCFQSSVEQQEAFNLAAGILIDCLIIAAVVYWRRRDRLIHIRFTRLEIIFTILLFLLNLFLSIILLRENQILNDRMFTTPSGIFLIVFLMIATLLLDLFFLRAIWKDKTTSYYKELNRQNRQYIENELRHFELYKSSQEDLKKFRHDMKHHLSLMAQLCQEERFPELQSYMARLQEGWKAAASPLLRTGDDMVDSVLNSKAFFMKKEHIAFTLSGSFAGRLPMEPFDLCAVFSNALDNAIEENRRLQDESKRYLSLSIQRSDHYYLISMKNPLHVPLSASSPDHRPEQGVHGFGLHSIREHTEKNGGSITIQSDREQFTLEILLPI